MTTAPTWHAADKAYQLHHVNCPTCAAAGRKPGELQRCPTGSELWGQYLEQHERENPRKKKP